MKKSLTIILLLAFAISYSQDYKFGKVSIEEVKNNVYEKDTAASAVILYKGRETYFNHEHPDGWIIITEYHERIKILKKSGLDYAVKKVNSYRSGSDKEKVMQIKGLTYNIENGKLESEKLKKNGIFKTENSDNWTETAITMPNVKVGSIIELTYKTWSPFWKIDDVVFQHDIPTKYHFSKIRTINYFNFKRIIKGERIITPNDYEQMRNTSFSWESRGLSSSTRSSNISIPEFIAEYKLRDIEALKEEPYVDNYENYISSVTYELQSYKTTKYSTTWDEVVKTLNKSESFGQQLDKTRFLKDVAQGIKGSVSGQNVIVKRVFTYIKDKMSWNENYGRYTRDGIQKAHKNGVGNVVEVNLLLVALLRECGVNANPVLLSTKKHGVPLFPTIEGFNYVVAGIENNGKVDLLDATEKFSTPNVLPIRALNWEGTMVGQDGSSKKVRVYPKRRSQKNMLVNINISDQGAITGSVKSSYTSVRAMEYRKRFENISKDDHSESILNAYKFSDISNFEIKNTDELEKPIQESYDFEMLDGLDMVGGKMYVSPLFFLTMTDNPFKAETREYPMDFVYPKATKRIISIKLPEGYEAGELPEPLKMALPDGMGSFLFNVSKVEGGINVIADYKINHAKIPAYKYPEVKQFFNQRVKKESEKIILKKI